MAATNYTPISIYYSTTAAATPSAGNLVNGELAINIQDGKLFYKDAAGVVQVIAGKGGAGVAGGSNTQVQYNSSGSLAGSANMTFNGTSLTLANDASISGLTVGKGGGNQTGQTALGTSAFASNSSGTYGTAVGYYAGLNNTTGQITALGSQSLYTNTTGSQNTGLGISALYYNSTGGNNTAVGTQALFSNTTASNNTAVGYQAAYSNVTGTQITAIGWQALKTSTGNYNSAFGSNSQRDTSTGTANTSVGISSMLTNTTGANNVAVGADALVSNTTASNNTAVGYQAGYSKTTGNGNLFVGYGAGYAATTGINNTFVGGIDSGYYMTTGSKNTILGSFIGNQGGLDIRTASNYIVLSDGDGNPRQWFTNNGYMYAPYLQASAGPQTVKFSTTTGAVTYDSSSARYKDNIRDSKYGLADVLKMQSRQFEYKEDGRSDVGLVAEELQPIIPELVFNDHEGLAQGVSYDRMVSVLVKAIQELKAEVDSLKQQLGK